MPITLATRGSRTQRTASQARSDARKWPGSEVFRDRLSRLIQETTGGSRTAFAGLIHVGTSHVSKWCDGGTAPGAEKLALMAQHTGVCLNWLLGLVDRPMYLGETREPADLDEDVAAYVARELTLRLPLGELAGEPMEWSVVGRRVLNEAIDSIEPRARHIREVEGSRTNMMRDTQAMLDGVGDVWIELQREGRSDLDDAVGLILRHTEAAMDAADAELKAAMIASPAMLIPRAPR